MFHTLIASDLDGTLLTQPGTPLAAELFPLIHDLRERGFLFCAASGRSYGSLVEIFAPVKDEIVFVTENGARVYADGELFYQAAMPEPLCRELVADIHGRPDCEARINIQDKVYRIAKDVLIADFLHLPGVRAMIPVSGWEELHDPITKISAFSPAGIQTPASVLLPKWQERVNASITGAYWLDFSAANKAIGLQKICKRYKIQQENTIAFGDSFNDVPMLEFVNCAYIMDTACAGLREKFPRQCSSVLDILSQIKENVGGTLS